MPECIANFLNSLKERSLHNSTCCGTCSAVEPGGGCTIGPALSSLQLAARTCISRSSQFRRLGRGGRPAFLEVHHLASSPHLHSLSFRNFALLNGLEPQAVTLLTCFYIVSCHSFFDLTFQTLFFLQFFIFLPLSLMVRFSWSTRVNNLTFCGTWHSIIPQHVFQPRSTPSRNIAKHHHIANRATTSQIYSVIASAIDPLKSHITIRGIQYIQPSLSLYHSHC